MFSMQRANLAGAARFFLQVLFLFVFLNALLGASPVQISEARGDVNAPLFGVQARAGEPQLILTKSTDNDVTTAKVGDTIFYRIRFACSSLTTDCGDVEITDVLPLNPNPPNDPLYTYVAANSDVPAGFHMTETSTGTLVITKDDHLLLDGSQYDAVIAVRVNYDTRPLPATIVNTVSGQIKPPGATVWDTPVTASTPPITVSGVALDWTLTKTLYSPSIEPTVDTDVTYQIKLCPGTTSGNVALKNIVITDTLPAGVTFVSASGSGTESAGVVTWNIAGPITPPNCTSRFVTVRYPTPTFKIGDPLTNSASATADYTPSDGGVCAPNCFDSGTIDLDHKIIDIAEGVVYSKSDAGDPVGKTGTARFNLSLDTNATNSPATAVVMTDNLLPGGGALQVTQVTSGTWSSTFDYVRAYIEYSTDDANSWTAFDVSDASSWTVLPVQPVSYNTNVTYTAPAANITNVRWRFEYDDIDPDSGTFTTYQGLPFDWSFSSTPEIRITPRVVATTADLPSGAVLPAAVTTAPNNIYTNCLQVSRIDSSGVPVTGACDNETMTVEGDYVSLRATKSETPGYAYDPIADPQILNFQSDTSILPNDTVRYIIRVDVTERSSAGLINPTIQDTLPPELVFVRNGIAKLDGVALPAAQQPTFIQSGQNLTWAWNNPSPALTVLPLTLGSRYLTVEFYARILPGTPPADYSNSLYVVTDSVDVQCEVGTEVQDAANGDVDVDFKPVDPACKNSDTFKVERSAALRGEKWIRSVAPENNVVVDSTSFLPASCPNGGTVGLTDIPTNPFTRYPCIAQAFPDDALSVSKHVPPPPAIDPTLDDFEYNLRIFNEGNVPMLRYVLYDILPYYGDKGSGGTLVGSARSSEFRPVLRGPVSFINGTGLTSANFTIKYSLLTNPCRPEVFDKSPSLYPATPAGCTNDWKTEAERSISDWTTVRAVRIELISGSIAAAVPAGNELRFGAPMSILKDAPVVGAFNNDDPQSHEIAWNSFSHVGAYDKDETAAEVIQDLLASEPRKVGITIPEVLSVGNRVWRDSDNDGTINAPDDATPGISGVAVNLYLASDTTTPISTATTDTDGYYLFSNLQPGSYVIGIPTGNFAIGQPLYKLRSSTGTPSSATYTNPATNVIDSADDGIDPATPGLEVFSKPFDLQLTTEPVSETDLSANDRDGIAGARRGVNAERDNNSDLTIDFGFFGGTDDPFSIGNHVWKDNGAGSGIVNDGIRQADEPPVVGARVNLYRDGNLNGKPDTGELIRYDITYPNGFYLFDNLDPGQYFVEIPASEFASGKPLAGWYSSVPTGTVVVSGLTTTADVDNDDDGINTDSPETTGVLSGAVILKRGENEPTGETYLSNQPDPDLDPTNNLGVNPTEWDGLLSRGRYNESDETSNLTIDFGFIPPMSLGNRVWIDEGAGTVTASAPFPGFNNGVQDGTEAGIGSVRVELWRDTNGTPGLQVSGGTPDTLKYFTTTDLTGYYLFERLQEGSDYFIHIPASNFTSGKPLFNYLSSTDSAAPADDGVDKNDNGIDSLTPTTTGITSPQITMTYNGEPQSEADLGSTVTYGADGRGLLGQSDANSNLTLDFGFVRPPRSIGNRLWFDDNNNGQIDGAESFVSGANVSLYLDANGDGQPDGAAIATDITDSNGYYLFDGLPSNKYVVGVDQSNFASGILAGFNSSKGSVDNAANNTDSLDNGVDRFEPENALTSPYGILSTSIDLTATPVNAPTGETGSGDTGIAVGFNPTAGDGINSRGRYGETDANSDLTIDFGFFKPMSLGNRVFLDDGSGGGTYNNGIMDGGELPIANVRVELWRDADTNGAPDTGGMIGFDTTDSGGYYLFDDLAEGSYVVWLPSSNFTTGGALIGFGSSTPTGDENSGVAGNAHTPNMDVDDNGINAGTPAATGILSSSITLAHNTEASGETELSGQIDPGSPADLAYSPTGWDGANSRGRWGETDANSNLTIDFGFIPVFSLGNRVWLDTNNSSARNGAEVGINGVKVQLFTSDGTTEILVGADGILNTADDGTGGMLTAGGGYYLFNNLPAGDYIVKIPASNFTGVLKGYWSSGTTISAVGVISETAAPDPDITATDSDDNGTRTSGDVISAIVTLGPVATPEPLIELDLSASGQGQPDAQANMTVDFGFYRVEIGNLVYMDKNANGNYESGAGADTVISGATVKLFLEDGSPEDGSPEINVGPDGILGTADDAAGGMTTNGSGVYLFSGLPQGKYIVKTSAPANTYSTIDTFNAADNATPTNADNNDNGIGTELGDVRSGTVTMTPGGGGVTITNATGTTRNLTIDFGFVNMVAIGNRLWLDTGVAAGHSNNGILDADETGVDDGVRVELRKASDNSLVAFTTTGTVSGNKGYYQFDNLYPATYYISIPASEFALSMPLYNYVSTLGAGTNETSDQTVDENGIDTATITTTGIRTRNYTLIAGSMPASEDQANYTGTLAHANVNFTADLGFVQLVAIGNRIWIDDGAAGSGVADNGIQDGTELGVNNVTVELYASGKIPGTDAPAATTTTDASGNYQFNNQLPGSYFVHIPASQFQTGGALNGYVSSTGAGGNETSDQIADENGIDATALAVTGISTQVYTLTPGSETIADDQTSYTGYLDNSNVNFTADFGFLQKVALGNIIWLDNGAGGGTANDGIKNGTEAGISGVNLNLYHVGDTPGVTTPAAITTTDLSGYYVFDNLLPGQYFVFIPALEFGTGKPLVNLLSSSGNGADETTDQSSDENGIDNSMPASNGITSTAYDLQPTTEKTGEAQPNYIGALDDNNINFTADFGFTELVAIGNRIWFDTGAGAFYNNGILDAGESGVDNVTVKLFTSAGVEVPVGLDGILGTIDDASGGTLTSGGGYYKFDRLYPGIYYVQIPADEFNAGGDLLGYVSTLDTAAKNQISDQDADENGIDTAALTTSGIITNNFTLLANVMPISEDQINYTGLLDDNNVNFTADFGFVQLVAIGNRIWLDVGTGGGTANNGIQDGAEAGIDAVTVELYTSANVLVKTTTTNASGDYQFDNLNPGSYYIHIPASQFQTGAALDGYLSSTGAGNDETSDQTADENGIDAANMPVNGISSGVYTLSPNTETIADDQSSYTGYLDHDNVNFTADFGFVQLVALGNRVWVDDGSGVGGAANDHIQNGSEPGVNGVRVELYLSTQTPGTDIPLLFTTTDSSGNYVFDNLLPETYVVYIPASEFATGKPLQGYYSSEGNGANKTTDQNGDENGIDQSAPALTGVTSTPYALAGNGEPTTDDETSYTGVLENNDVNFTADFGFVQKYSLGNRIWFDTNNNSQMNSGEVGVDDILVELYKADTSGYPTGAAIAADTTTGGGFYFFDDLFPRDYVVVVAKSNFDAGGILRGYWSSASSMDANGLPQETPAALPNTDADVDDNGTLDTSAGALKGAVISQAVTLGPSGNSEPVGEIAAQLESGVLGSQGNQPDGRANMTVDFGFYKAELGNLVYSDGNKNGNYESASDIVLANVTVQLFASDGVSEILVGADGALGTADDGAGGMATDSNGLYLFSRLPAGTYIVTVTAPDGTNSTTDTFNAAGDNATPNINADDNDNGIGTGSGAVSSGAFDLTPGSLGALNKNTVTNATGTTFNPTLDFGFIPVFSLGNRVWFDTNNNNSIDVGESGVDNVNVHLFASNGTTEILVGADGILGTADDNTDGVLTSGNGYYLFNNLPEGSYVVFLPAANFSGILKGYWSSGTSRSDAGALIESAADLANSDTDLNDNGTRQLSGAVTSSIVTLGPNTNTEPTTDGTDLDTGGQGQPDMQANMAVDFGFYTITLGDLVWNDANNDGLTPGESGLAGVSVQLWAKDGIAPLATTTTVGGNYSFTGLAEGNYYIRIPATEFNPGGSVRDYISSTGSLFAYEPGKDVDGVTVNSDDNGTATGAAAGPDGTYNASLGLGGYVRSSVFALTPAAEESVDATLGLTVENRVDFGLYSSLQIDLEVTKTDNVDIYIPDGTLNYEITITNNGPSDVINAQVDDALPAQIASWVWACAPGTPAARKCTGAASNSSAFQDFIDLPQGASVTYNVTATIIAAPSGILENIVTVTPPIGITELNNTNNTASDKDDLAALQVTKDDSLQIVSPGSPVIYEIIVTNNGMVDMTTINVTDTLPANLTNISASPAPTTQTGNALAWSGIALTAGSSITITVTADVIANPSSPITNTVNVIDTTTGAHDTADDIDRVALSDIKTLTATSEADSGNGTPASPEPVFIGETLTYVITLTLPPGTVTNLTADDTLHAGLAFDECTTAGVAVSSPLVTTSLAGGFPDACPAASADARVTNSGHNVQFTFGDVTNASSTDQTITVEYQVIVLDIAANANGVTGLNNSVTWSWVGGSLSSSATPVEIIEPTMSIKKSAAPRVAGIGSTITFTLTIAHTVQSTADAYDVIATDILPAGLGYVPSSAFFSAGNVPPTSIGELGNTLTIIWDYFPLQVAALPATATITFQAIFLGPSPAINEASVAWTSLPIDPGLGGVAVVQSNYNPDSTERWYDPADLTGVDDYRILSNVHISTPQLLGVEKLPVTGFAPNIITQLPAMPKDFAYAQTSLALEIPALKTNINIVGVPFADQQRQWNITWLNADGGWLEQTAFPTHNGNSAITAHAYLANGLPGPFAKLNMLKYGDQAIVHLDGQKYIYEVRENKRVTPYAVDSVLKHEDLSWLTLITCQTYDDVSKEYRYRVVVRAVLVEVK